MSRHHLSISSLPRTGHEGPEGEQMYSSTVPIKLIIFILARLLIITEATCIEVKQT